MNLHRVIACATASAVVVLGTATGVAVASAHSRAGHYDSGHGKIVCGIADNGLPYPPGSGTMASWAHCAIKWRVSIPAYHGTRLVLIAPNGHFTVWRTNLDYSK